MTSMAYTMGTQQTRRTRPAIESKKLCLPAWDCLGIADGSRRKEGSGTSVSGLRTGRGSRQWRQK